MTRDNVLFKNWHLLQVKENFKAYPQNRVLYLVRAPFKLLEERSVTFSIESYVFAMKMIIFGACAACAGVRINVSYYHLGVVKISPVRQSRMS